MRWTRLAVLAAAAAVAAAVGAARSWAPHPVWTDRPLYFRFGDSGVTGVGFDLTSARNAHPPVGSRLLVTIALLNGERRWGKPKGARIGRLVLDCGVVAPGRAGDCRGVASLPGGFFTVKVPPGAVAFGGATPFARAIVKSGSRLPVLGGVGAYAGVLGNVVVNSPADVRAVL